MGYCSNCGKKLDEGSIYCCYCGTKVMDEIQQEEDGHTQSTPEFLQNHNVVQNTVTYQIPYGYQNPNGYQDQNSYQDPNIYQSTNVYQNPNPYQPQNGYSYMTFNPNNHNSTIKGRKAGLMIGITAAVITLIALLAVVVTLIAYRTPDYERPLENMTKALESGNYEKLIHCYPDFMQDSIKSMMDYYGDGDPDDAMDEMIDQFEESYGDGIKITYKIKDKEKLFNSDLDALKDSIKNDYNENVSIEDGYKLDIDIVIEGDDDNDTEDTTLNVVKIDGKWFLFNNFMKW